jgi:hypothetical protein
MHDYSPISWKGMKAIDRLMMLNVTVWLKVEVRHSFRRYRLVYSMYVCMKGPALSLKKSQIISALFRS